MKTFSTKNILFSLVLLLATSFSSTLSAQCPTSGSGVTVVSGNNNNTYNLNTGNVLVISSGTFSGNINFNGAATICISSGATFSVSNMNNFGSGSVINNYGTTDIQNSLSLNGGTINNYNYMRLRTNPNQNGAVAFVNAQGGYWQFDQAFTLQNGSSFTNNGNLHAAGDFSTNSGTTFTNNFRIRTAGNLNPAGNFNNYGIAIAVGFININSGDKTINYCRMVSESGFNNNDGDTENRGLLWVTKPVTGGQFWWQNNSTLTNTGYIRTTSFQNNSNIVNTNGTIRIEGGSGILSRNNGGNTISGGVVGDISNAGYTFDVNLGTITATYQNVAAYDTTSQQYISSCSNVYIPATYTVSGNVYNDNNGMKDNNVNGSGIGTASGQQLYAQLVNASNKVVANVSVGVNGAFTFSNVSNGSYTVQISTVQGSNGNNAPAVTLPTNWVNTSEKLGNGTGNDGNTNGILSITVNNANVSNANFGIEKRPIAVSSTASSQTNPGGTNYVTVSSSLFSATDTSGGNIDSILITAFPTNATSIEINGTVYNSGNFPVAGVRVRTNANGNTTQTVKIDPIDGSVTSVISFRALDNAGFLSNNTATVSLPFVDRTITVNASSLCSNDAPYLTYNVTANFDTTGLKATIQWVNPSNQVVATYTNQPLSANILWPGAGVDGNGAGNAWPGWSQPGLPSDPTWIYNANDPFATLRNSGSKVVITVNPTSEAAIFYPSSSPSCSVNPLLAIKGKVHNDGNGMTDNNVNGPGTRADSVLYANLLDALNQVVDTVRVKADGTFAFYEVSNGNYTVQISSIAGTIGAAAPAVVLPYLWENTGEYWGIGAGSDNNPNSRLAVVMNGANVENVRFGINKTPISNNVSQTPQSNPGGNVQVQVPDLHGDDNEDGQYQAGAKLKIITLPVNAILYYNGVPVAVNQEIVNYNPSLMTVDPDEGVVTVAFRYMFIDAANAGSVEPATVTMPFEITILPVELVYFNVSKENKTAVLEWATASEKNNSHFIIWRSTDGVNFEQVGTVAGNGNSAVYIEYAFEDMQPASGINYYQLEQVDFDGVSEKSPIRSVEFGAAKPVVQLYPNPFVDNVQISGLDVQKEYLLMVYTLNGQLVKSVQLNTVNNVAMQNLNTGLYLMKIVDASSNTIVHTQKLIRK